MHVGQNVSPFVGHMAVGQKIHPGVGHSSAVKALLPTFGILRSDANHVSAYMLQDS